MKIQLAAIAITWKNLLLCNCSVKLTILALVEAIYYIWFRIIFNLCANNQVKNNYAKPIWGPIIIVKKVS